MDPVVMTLLVVPFAGALICGVLSRGAKALAVLTALVVTALATVAVWRAWPLFPDGVNMSFGRLAWMPGYLGSIQLFGALVDPLSSLMLLLVTVVGFVVVLYSTGYLTPGNAEHAYREGDNRYYFWLLFFLGSMVGVALSPNLLQMFFFWEMTTICSWALISHTHTGVAQRAGFKALVITHIGGLGFLIALAFLLVFAQSFDFAAIGKLGGGLKTAAFLLLLGAAWAKSAQVPFHTWLPDAMEAPTPISAYLHAAAMVKAGVFLVARLVQASWEMPSLFGAVLLAGALITILMAVVNYFRQDDLKRLLAYSTIAHLGYVMLGCALGVYGSEKGFQGGVLHLLCHGVAKGTLFLCAGALAYGAGTRRISKLQGMGRRMPLVGAAFMVGVLAVTGIPPLATFWSKLYIFIGALGVRGGGVLLAVLAVESVVAFSWFIYVGHRIFLGEPAEEAETTPLPAAMSVSLVIGMLLCVLAPVLGVPLVRMILP